MLFQTQEFCLLFLPLAVLVYYMVARSPAARQNVLIGASLFFYGWWDVRFIPLLLGQISASWLLANLAQKCNARWPLHLGVIVNILALATFKYLDFLVVAAETLSGLALPRAGLLLPIGISFFSFQLVSYLIDRLRNDAPLYPFRSFALFVMLFPHLIAGPIVRHNELIPQFFLDPRREGLWSRLGNGLILLVAGLAKKILIADKLAPISDQVFAQALTGIPATYEAWNGVLAFNFQLFFDFSAYSDMAIGIALLFGLTLPENFRRPYLAGDLRDFWRRWHMSLSAFLRDYLYVPLGGNRHGRARQMAATLATMGICGLWHGAGVTYVLWGLWHGIGLIICQVWQGTGRRLPRFAAWFLTAIFVLAGWVVFRAGDVSSAAHMFSALAGQGGSGGTFRQGGLIVVAAILSVTLPSAHEFLSRAKQPTPWLAGGLAMLAAYCLAEVGSNPSQAFIYFQF